MPESAVSPRRVEAAQKRRRALQLRAAGANFDRIAEQIGYDNKGSAYRAVAQELRQLCQEPAEEVRDLELARLDQMQAALWPQAMRGQLGAIDRVLKIMERRARYLGLDEQTTAPPDEHGNGGVPLRELFATDPQRALDVARWLHDNLPAQPRVVDSDAS